MPRCLLPLAVVGCLLGPLSFASANEANAASSPAYLVGTSDGTTLKFSVDGHVVAQGPAGGVPPNRTPTAVEIGAFMHGETFYGTIDEVALYSRPLDASAIQQHYAIGTGKTGGSYEQAVK